MLVEALLLFQYFEKLFCLCWFYRRWGGICLVGVSVLEVVVQLLSSFSLLSIPMTSY